MTFHIRLCLFFCVQLFFYVKASIPTELLCANPTCQEPISKAQGSVTYASSSRNVLSFKPGQEITIISKSKNKNDYWGAVINGRVGYVPSHLIKETRIFHQFDTLVPVTIQSLMQNASTNPKEKPSSPPNTQIPNENVPKGNPNEVHNLPPVLLNTVGNTQANPSSINQPSNLNDQNPVPAETYKVVEGTTVYANDPIITPSPTVDAKPNQQTTAFTSGADQQQQKLEQDRATIPPDVINLMGDYQGQLLMSKENLTLETADDAEVSDGEEGDFENDDEDEDDEEEEEMEEEESRSENDAKNMQSEEKGSAEVKEEVKVTVSESSETQPETNAYQGTTPPSFQPQPIIAENVQTETVTEKTVMDEGKNEAVPDTLGGQFTNPTEPTISSNTGSDNIQTGKIETPTTASSPDMLSSGPGPGILGSSPGPDVGSGAIPNVLGSGPVPNVGSGPVPNVGSGPVPNVGSGPVPNVGSGPVPNTLGSSPVPTVGSGPVPNVLGSSPDPNVEKDFTTIIPPAVTTENLQLHQNEQYTTPMPPDTKPYLNQYSVAADATVSQPPPVVDEKPLQGDSPPSTPSTLDTPSSEIPTPLPPVLNNFNTYTPSHEVQQKPNENIQEKIQNSIEDQIELTTEAPSNFVKVNDIVIERTTEQAKKEETVPPTQSTDAVQDPSSIPSVETLTTPEPLVQAEEAPGIFSQVAETVSGWFGSSSDKATEMESAVDSSAMPDLPKEDFKIPDVKPTVGFETESPSSIAPDVYEKPISNPEDLIAEEQPSSWTSWLYSSLGTDGSAPSSNTFMYLVVTAITVLMFTLGHSYIEKSGKTGPLIAKINKLEQELLVTSKECILLKEEVQSAKEKIILYENSANDELVLSLQAELEESKKARLELESSIEVLQQELDAATEAGLDLNKMLSEVLTQKGGSESLLKSVESLQAQLNSQQQVIDEMTKKLGIKNQENEALQIALDAANEKSESLEDQIKDTNHNFNLLIKEKEDLALDLKSQINQLQVRINQLTDSKGKEIKVAEKKIEELQKKLSETTKALAIKEEEFKALKESVKQLKTKGNTNLEVVFDVSRIKAELAQAEKENKALQEKLKEEENSKKALEEANKAFNLSVENMKKQLEEAEQKKDEAEKKLEVLSTYFKEKETQLQKELGMQEALWAQKKGDEKAVYNMMKSLQEEVDSYKSQNETLKKEILDQERGLKNQIAILEQKAHENWVAARQAERKLEETKQETAQLRNRLTLIEKNSNNVEGKANHRVAEELNGEPPTSPVLHDTSSPLLFPPMPLDPSSSSMLPPGFMPHPMFMPPPMGGFIPPPPFLPGDRRPPPLGRMSSPPLNSRFSPSSPADYPFERMPSPPLSPPVRNYRSPNEADREHYRHRTPPYPPMLPRNWEDGSELPGFIPISSQRDSVREHKGSNVSSGHSSSDSLDKSSRHSGRV